MGETEAAAVVELQRTALQTESMTIPVRLALMRAPDYSPELDLVVEAPNGKLAAFCFCTLERGDQKGIGYAEPIGTHPAYRGVGLGKALLCIALKALSAKGCRTARLSTSAENIPMQHLAESLGFTLDDDLLWFSKSIRE
jgi:ribosomal protein S18 acetylase RimI-like enzyme